MDHNQIHKNRDIWFDNYLRNELSERETDLFEEHLLHCKDCRIAVSERNRIVGSLEDIAAREVFSISSKGKNKPRKLRSGKHLTILRFAAAAGIAILIGLFIIYDRDHPSSPSQAIIEEEKTDTLIAPHREKIAGNSQRAEKDLSSDSGTRNPNLEDFQPHPVYESLIGISYRSSSLKVESPADSISCQMGDSLKIKFRGAQSDSLIFVLLNCRGELVLERMLASPYMLKMQYKEGLYYWQLNDEEESLHTAKILVSQDP